MILHPHKAENGRPVQINSPDCPTNPATWTNSNLAACFTPGCEVPESLNDITISKVAPAENYGEIEEPILTPQRYTISSGIVCIESDRRVWLVTPTNHFAGYHFTFPKGICEPWHTLQQTAIKETYEETGLVCQITDFLGDYYRTVSQTRFYVGKRIGGSPAEMHWESQSVHLVPMYELLNFVHTPVDRRIVQDLKKLFC